MKKQEKDIYLTHNEFYFTPPTEALPTANFKDFYYGEAMFKAIRSISKDFPLVNTEFWSGWFDHWNKDHAKSNALSE